MFGRKHLHRGWQSGDTLGLAVSVKAIDEDIHRRLDLVGDQSVFSSEDL